MPIVHECSAPDCQVLTMGEYCMEHEGAETDASLIDVLTPGASRPRPVPADAPR